MFFERNPTQPTPTENPCAGVGRIHYSPTDPAFRADASVEMKRAAEVKVNYSDLTRPISPKWWWKVREMGPL